MIGTGKNIDATRTFIADQPAVWNNLLAKLVSTVAFLRDLMADGAVAYQLFRLMAGLLTPSEYQQYALAHHQQIFAETGGHSILFVKDGPPVETRLASGCSALSIGKDDDLADLVKRYPHITFQGNVDHELLITGSADEVSATTRACLSAGRGGRHILNLDHGMDRNAKEENFAAFIETAKIVMTDRNCPAYLDIIWIASWRVVPESLKHRTPHDLLLGVNYRITPRHIYCGNISWSLFVLWFQAQAGQDDADVNEFRLMVCELEDRIVPIGTVSWTPEQTSFIRSGQAEGITAFQPPFGNVSNPVSGAVHVVVTHPTNPDIMWVGGTNGGIWRTNNATAQFVNWIPVFDQQPSLSIGAINLDPTDPTSNTLVAGIGRFSSFGRDGGSEAGAFRSTDGGYTWNKIGGTTLDGRRISAVISRGNVIVVAATNQGVWRSTNAGASFSFVPTTAGSGCPIR